MPDPIINHSTYVAFFKELAESHVDIKHSSTKKAFVRITLNRDPLLSSKHQINEFLINEKHKLKGPFMILISYSGKYSNVPPGDKQKSFMGGFAILDQVERNDDFESENEIIDKCEIIGEDILSYMVNYYEEDPGAGEVIDHNFSSDAITKLGANNYAGRIFRFDVNIHEDNLLQFNPAKFS